MPALTDLIRDLTKQIEGYETLLVALKYSANADPSFKLRSAAVIPQIENWLKENNALLAGYKRRAAA